MDTSTLSIILNAIVLISLLIPAVRGYIKGFVKTAVHLLRFVVAFIVASFFSKTVGPVIKEKWLGDKFYGIVDGAVRESFDGSAGGMADAVPTGLRALLETFGVDIGGAANDAAATGEQMVNTFVANISDKLASIASVALAFVGVFILTLLLLRVVAKLLNFLVERIPLVRGINRILGLATGCLIGIVTAWTVSQAIVFVLTTFTHIDYSQAAVLNFFHDISPVRWILQLIAHGMTDFVAGIIA